MIRIEKPKEGEYNPDVLPYINLLPGDGRIIKYLADNFKKNKNFILSIPRKKLSYSYAPNKCTMKEILLHLMDEERIYTYRALRIARNDKTPLPGYNADEYNLFTKANERSTKNILKEYDTVRNATISLFKSFDEAVFLRTGTAVGNSVSVRAIAYHRT